MKMRLTRKVSKTRTKQKSIPWRDVYKKEILQYSEGGLMLRGSRQKMEITQKELAEALGMNQHHISEIENGKRPIGKEIAKRLASYFKIDYRLFL